MTTERDPGRPADQSPTTTWTPPNTIEERPSPTGESARVVRGGDSRLRWGIALLVTALVIGVAAATLFLLNGGSSPSKVLGHVPTDRAAVYGEFRLDLPGDQRQQLGEFLSKFPGFEDQSTLDVKLDDALDQLLRAMTDGTQAWTTDVKPWFDGELAFAVPSLPEVTADGAMAEGRFLMLAAVKDEAAARAWLEKSLAGTSTTTADHGGTSLFYFGEGAERGAAGVAHGSILLAGDAASVEAAIDLDGQGGLAANDSFEAARDALEGDGLGYLYADLGLFREWIREASVAAGEDLPFDVEQLDMIPEWAAVRVQARGDALAFESVMPHVDGPLDLDNRAGQLAQGLPPSTIGVVDLHGVGPALEQAIEDALADPEMADETAEIRGALQFLGGVDGVVGWMQDAGLAITRDGDDINGGLVFGTEDREEAESLLTTLKGLIALGGPSMGMSISDEAYGGATITTVNLGSLEDLGSLFVGGLGPVPGPVPVEGDLELSFVTTDQVMAIGLGDSFPKAVVDAAAGPSLAESERYRSLLARVGAENTSTVFLDITAVREMAEDLMAAADPRSLARYEAEVKPYLLPFDAFIQASSRDGDLDRSTGVIVVK